VLESAAAVIDAETTAEFQSCDPFPAQVRTVVETKIRGFLVHVEATRVLLAFWSDRDQREGTAPLFQRWRRQAAALLRAGQARGEVELSVDAEAFGAVLVGLVIGVVVQSVYVGPIDVDKATELAVRAALGVWGTGAGKTR
jgi:hypothetical protein